MFLQWVLKNSLYSLWRHFVRHPKRAVVESSSNGISCPYLGLEYNDAFRIAALPWCHQIISSLFLRVLCGSMKVVRQGYTQIRNKCIGISNLFKIRYRNPVVQGWYHHWDSGWGHEARCAGAPHSSGPNTKRKGEERNGRKTKFLLFYRWCHIYVGSIYVYLSLQFGRDERFWLLFFRWVGNQLAFDLWSHTRG